MTLRSPMSRTFCVIVMFIFAASTLLADQAPKRRAVNPGGGPKTVEPPTTVLLTGAVVDSVTGAPVIAVEVSIPGKSGHTDTSGHFFINLLIGQDFTLQLVRTGYESSTAKVNLTSPATQTFQMVPKPTTTVKLTSGKTYEVDTETVEFGYVAPFSGYNEDTKLNLCKAGGDSYTPDRSEIKRITPAAQVNDAVCCKTAPLPAINIELKAGGTVVGAFSDACFGYKVDVIAQEHATTNPVYIHFSDIAEVTLP